MAANFLVDDQNLIADLGGDPANPTALPAAGLGPDPNAQPLVGNLVNVGLKIQVVKLWPQ